VKLDANLNLLPKKFNVDVANQSGNKGDRKISDCENVLNGESQALSLTICVGKLAHQKVGIE